MVLILNITAGECNPFKRYTNLFGIEILQFIRATHLKSTINKIKVKTKINDMICWGIFVSTKHKISGGSAVVDINLNVGIFGHVAVPNEAQKYHNIILCKTYYRCFDWFLFPSNLPLRAKIHICLCEIHRTLLVRSNGNHVLTDCRLNCAYGKSQHKCFYFRIQEYRLSGFLITNWARLHCAAKYV